jgi:hypothetical protein
MTKYRWIFDKWWIYVRWKFVWLLSEKSGQWTVLPFLWCFERVRGRMGLRYLVAGPEHRIQAGISCNAFIRRIISEERKDYLARWNVTKRLRRLSARLLYGRERRVENRFTSDDSDFVVTEYCRWTVRSDTRTGILSWTGCRLRLVTTLTRRKRSKYWLIWRDKHVTFRIRLAV